jgi:hypothetical protein
MRGGSRPNSGRKSKTDEQKLIDSLAPLHPKVIMAIESGINNMDFKYIKLYLQYMYGVPRLKPEPFEVDIEKNLPEWMND